MKPYSKKEEDFMKEYIEKLEQKDFIRRSKPRGKNQVFISHGTLFVYKKDGMP